MNWKQFGLIVLMLAIGMGLWALLKRPPLLFALIAGFSIGKVWNDLRD